MPTRSSLTLLLTFLATFTAVAAPAPKPKPKPWVTGWKEVDPDKDCKFVRDGEVLTIAVPGKDHDLAILSGLKNSPRLLRAVEGDFIAQVRVSGSFTPSFTEARPRRAPVVSAGLSVMVGQEPYLTLQRGARGLEEEDWNYADLTVRLGEHEAQTERARLQGNELHLRLERRGDRLLSSFSEDGKDWTDCKALRARLPAELYLSIFAASTSSAPFRARFDQFHLTLTGKKGRR